MGRKKISIQPIVHNSTRRATFEKRRIGLLKKAMELSILCKSSVSLTIYTDDGEVYIYSSEPYENIINKFQNYSGPYRLLTNDHLNQLIPGKSSSSNIGYGVVKQPTITTNTTATTQQPTQTQPQFQKRFQHIQTQHHHQQQHVQQQQQQHYQSNIINQPNINHTHHNINNNINNKKINQNQSLLMPNIMTNNEQHNHNYIHNNNKNSNNRNYNSMNNINHYQSTQNQHTQLSIDHNYNNINNINNNNIINHNININNHSYNQYNDDNNKHIQLLNNYHSSTMPMIATPKAQIISTSNLDISMSETFTISNNSDSKESSMSISNTQSTEFKCVGIGQRRTFSEMNQDDIDNNNDSDYDMSNNNQFNPHKRYKADISNDDDTLLFNDNDMLLEPPQFEFDSDVF